MNQLGDFPAATMDALVNQNKNLNARLNETLHYTRELEKQITHLKNEVISAQILEKECESEAKRTEAENKNLKQELLLLKESQSKAEMTLAQTLSEFSSLNDRLRLETRRSKKYEGMYFRLKSRLRRWIRPAWLLIGPEIQRFNLLEKKYRERNRVLKEQVESASRHIQTQEIRFNEQIESIKKNLESELVTARHNANDFKEKWQTIRKENISLENKNKELQSEVLRFKNESISKIRIESDTQKHLLKKIEDQQSRIFVLMTENKQVQIELKDNQKRLSEANERREVSESKWAELRIQHEATEKKLETALLSLKTTQSKEIDSQSIQTLTGSIKKIENSLKKEIEGPNELFEEVQLAEHDFETGEEPEIQEIKDPKLSQIDRDLLEIQSEYFRLNT